MKFFPYNQINISKARELRKNMTLAEKKIWYEILKGKQFKGLKFLKQKPIGNYIVDFYCAKLKLVIEIDGDTHTEIEQIEYDKKRTEFLSNLRIKVIRYKNSDILNNIEAVYQNLQETIESHQPLFYKEAIIQSKTLQYVIVIPLLYGNTMLV